MKAACFTRVYGLLYMGKYKNYYISFHSQRCQLQRGDLKSGESPLYHPSPCPLNNNDQTTPSHKSTQFPNTIITWDWLQTLYEVLHAVKITTFTLMNEEIIFASKMRVQKMPQRLYYESKKSCNFWKNGLYIIPN